MATVSAEHGLVVLATARRSDVLLLSADAAHLLSHELIRYADLLDPAALDRLVLGDARLHEPIRAIWDVRVGLYARGVALKFNQFTTRIPMPPVIARALASRVSKAATTYQRGYEIRVVKTGKAPAS